MSFRETISLSSQKGETNMICKRCYSRNDNDANFCSKCGGELYEGTLVTSPVTDRVTAQSVPTSGIRAFSGIGNGYLHSAAMTAFTASEAEPRSDTYHSYPTRAKVHLSKNGTWICPDCGELNGHEKLWCTGCGKYR